METLIKLLLGFAFIIFVTYMGYQIQLEATSEEYVHLTTNLEDVQRGNAEIEKKNELLRIKIESLKNDPRAIERKVRDELGLVRPDEIIVFFTTPDGKMAEWGNAGQRLVNNKPVVTDDENESDDLKFEDVFGEPSQGGDDMKPEESETITDANGAKGTPKDEVLGGPQPDPETP